MSGGGELKQPDASDAAGAHSSKPFAIPADEDIFKLQAEFKADIKAEKAAAAGRSVMDKTTFAARQQALFSNDAIKAGFIETLKPKAQDVAAGAGSLAAAAVSGVPRRPERRDNLKNFLAKKRETFLMQMSLDTKRAEIQKLEERARQRDEALKKSEAMLEEDGLRFDAFLKDNDEKVQEAIKRADVEAKAKQDKVFEIKRLNAAITSLKSELNKQEEALEDCRRYKDFLNSVTPKEWFVAQAAKEQVHLWQRREAAAAARAKAEADYNSARTQQEAERAERSMKEAAAALKVYADLEESNLFLIQNCQEAEEQLEEIKGQYHAAEQALSTEVEGLKVWEAAEAAAFHDNPAVMLGTVDVVARNVPKTLCGFDADASLSTLSMLTSIEVRLEEALAAVGTLPAEVVADAEKGRERERRQVAREEKLAAAQAEHELRVQRALERAAAPIFKKTGKPVMFRSQPPQRKDSGMGIDVCYVHAHVAPVLLLLPRILVEVGVAAQNPEVVDTNTTGGTVTKILSMT
eukprot:gene9162-9328_t